MRTVIRAAVLRQRAAVDIVGGVGLGDAQGLRFLQCFVEGSTIFHLREDYVCGSFRMP